MIIDKVTIEMTADGGDISVWADGQLIAKRTSTMKSIWAMESEQERDWLHSLDNDDLAKNLDDLNLLFFDTCSTIRLYREYGEEQP